MRRAEAINIQSGSNSDFKSESKPDFQSKSVILENNSESDFQSKSLTLGSDSQEEIKKINKPRKRQRKKRINKREMERRIRELDDSLYMEDSGKEENIGVQKQHQEGSRIRRSLNYLEVGDPPQDRVLFETESLDQGLILMMRLDSLSIFIYYR